MKMPDVKQGIDWMIGEDNDKYNSLSDGIK